MKAISKKSSENGHDLWSPRGASGNGKYRDILAELQRERDDLLRAVAARPLSEGIEVTLCPDLNDQASAEIDQHCALRLKERDRNLLKQIDDALDRIATERYGICENCAEEIPVRRLKVRPMTTLCVDCKMLEEEQERIRR